MREHPPWSHDRSTMQDARAPLPSTRTAPFFALTLALSFTLQTPALLAKLSVISGPYEKYLPLVGLGALGPMIIGLLLSSQRAGGPGVRTLFAGLAPRRSLAGWYVFALLLPGILLTVPLALYAIATGTDVGPWAYPPNAPERWIALVLFPIGEELGWRGYAQPRLLQRYSALTASMIVGGCWALWHLLMFVIEGSTLFQMIASVPLFLAGSVIYTWAYTRTNHSLLVAVLLHVGVHLNNSHRALPANALPANVHTIAHVAFALALLAIDRETFSSRKDTVPPKEVVDARSAGGDGG